ncbi:MAG: YifB family Mg chelatase-like AAA ATPase [Clostridiales bacterium]|jgi:magnesium chelatase family protein|nr:YifB family Mg chelatase-like AAA ATPase [Clostridiales bacterium]
MLAKIISGALAGIDAYTVDVETDLCGGLPKFEIVGLPDSAVKESKDRVRTAIKNCGYAFPSKQITINLAPADTRKEGPAFDLPIAVGILVCMNIIKAKNCENAFIIGELSLDGVARPASGVLSMVCHMKNEGVKTMIVPFENGEEAALIGGVDIVAVKSLTEVVAYFNGGFTSTVDYRTENVCLETPPDNPLDFSDVKGQDSAKRALEIAAAGAHNVLMIGPPGSGKTMMAKRLPGILPDMGFDESIETTKIYSVAGMLANKRALITKRPFRSPHHTISYSALTGGGRVPKPGEISLAHNGVLFLDELPEFQKNALEVMRQPMEDGNVTIARINGTFTYPSDFMLVCSMNPCPCGYYGSGPKCACSQNEISKYLNRVSGPLLDRIDIQVEISAVSYDDLGPNREAEPSAEIKARVLQAIAMQNERFKDDATRFNAGMSSRQIEAYCALGDKERKLLKKAFERLNLSGRAYHKILKVARTIADLDHRERVETAHLSEAIQYRSLDRKYWG